MKICLISESVITDDPRVRRQGDALTAAGHDVVAIGWRGGRGSPPGWPVIGVEPPKRTTVRRLHLAAAAGAGGWLDKAERAYWSVAHHNEFGDAASSTRADLFLANDWKVLPVAGRAAGAIGAAYAYDSHEYGVEEGADRRAWRLLFPRYIHAIESRYIGKAAFVSTVGQGIAELLQQAYDLDRTPLVIRNVPTYQHMEFRSATDDMAVLYHGIFVGDRCLRQLVDSVVDWPANLRLVLRGYGPARVEQDLRKRAAASPASERIEFVPAARPGDLVRLANEADIGIFATPATTNHTRYCLPNKVFEYIMAGLALCVSDNGEMGPLVRSRALGAVIETPTPGGIASVLAGLSRDDVNDAKRRSLEAARELNWEEEQQVLLSAVAGL